MIQSCIMPLPLNFLTSHFVGALTNCKEKEFSKRSQNGYFCRHEISLLSCRRTIECSILIAHLEHFKSKILRKVARIEDQKRERLKKIQTSLSLPAIRLFAKFFPIMPCLLRYMWCVINMGHSVADTLLPDPYVCPHKSLKRVNSEG